jgi:hypothetical protein
MTELAPKAEAIADVKESGHKAGARTTQFEPEVLAFCCEH